MLPLSVPLKGYKGEDIHEIFIPKGTDLHVSIISANRNPALWGLDYAEWKPERWINPLPEALVNAKIPGIYSHLLVIVRSRVVFASLKIFLIGYRSWVVEGPACKCWPTLA